MSPKILTAKDIVALGLYGSTDSVHRGWKAGEIAKPFQTGQAYKWDADAFHAFLEKRVGILKPKRKPKTVIKRTRKPPVQP